MGIKLFFLPVPRTLFFKTLTHFRSNFSIFADSSNAASQNLFLRFVTTRFNISSADAAKMVKKMPSLGRLKTLVNVEEVVSVLNRSGCSEHLIASIIRSQPSLLVISADRLLEPKLQLLKDFGMGGENLTKIATWLPRILTAKLEFLRSNLELLKTVFPTQDLLIRVIRNSRHIYNSSLQETLRTSVAFWDDFGFHGTELAMFFLINPWVMMRTSLSPGQLDLIRRIDIPKERKSYKHVVSAVALCRIEVLEARIHNLQRFSLSLEEVLQVVRACPKVLELSEENINKKMDFMLNNMELSVDFLVKHPIMFTLSLDKVMRPRFLVCQNMRVLNGGEKTNPTRLVSILRLPKAKFIAQIIRGHPESAILQTVYENAIVNVSKQV